LKAPSRRSLKLSNMVFFGLMRCKNNKSAHLPPILNAWLGLKFDPVNCAAGLFSEYKQRIHWMNFGLAAFFFLFTKKRKTYCCLVGNMFNFIRKEGVFPSITLQFIPVHIPLC
ncbi:MAG TPA: hypothetical protein PLU64_13580, partial [Saprospiraceae bacterium]|nr:hypothetical protein [Saprospiraceae bacterium]